MRGLSKLDRASQATNFKRVQGKKQEITNEDAQLIDSIFTIYGDTIHPIAFNSMADDPPLRSVAEIEADLKRLRDEKRRAEEAERQQTLEKRRARMGEATTSSIDRQSMLAPASPSPKKKSRFDSNARDGKLLFVSVACFAVDGLKYPTCTKTALMNPVQTNTSRKLLSSHRSHEGDMYRLPRFEKDPSASRSSHPVASSSSHSALSSSKRKHGHTRDLEGMLANESAASRLAPKHKLRESSAHSSSSPYEYGLPGYIDLLASCQSLLRYCLCYNACPSFSAPSNLLNASHSARQSLKDAEGRRGAAMHRSTAFNDTAPPPPKHALSRPVTTSTQPIPSYNAGHRGSYNSRFKDTYFDSASTSGSSRAGSSAYGNADYKGKSVDRTRSKEDSRRQQEVEPATRHTWQSRTSATADFTSEKKDDNENGYYSFEDEEEDSKYNGYEEDDENGSYQDIHYKPIGNERNDDLTLVHRLRPGPRRFKALESDPGFESVEPNSKIRLR